MTKSIKDWLREGILSSKIPIFIYDLDSKILLKKTMRSDGEIVSFEVLLCATALCKTGKKTDISDEIINRIFEEIELILSNRPRNDILGLDFLGIVRGLRPAWFTCSIYLELLKPFDNQIKGIFGSNLEEIFNSALIMADSKEADIPLPAPLYCLKSLLTIQHSEINSLADLWDKLFVQLNDNYLITLTYKIADVIYLTICKKLQDSIPQFGENKGKSLEKYVNNRLNIFMPKYYLYNNYCIGVNEKEKDSLIVGKDIGFAFECKSTRIRGSSAVWSKLNAFDDVQPVLYALGQIRAPMKLLKDGGEIHYKGRRHKIKPKEIKFGFIITDQIYTPYLRAAIDDVGNIDSHVFKGEYEIWHGREIWVGSVLDFCFLLEVALTPSVLIDYLRWIRSAKHLRYCDEPEAWIFYCTEPITPIVKRIPANILGDGFNWKEAKSDGLKKFHPFWLERSDLVKKLDLSDSILNAINIIRQDREKATRITRNKR